MTDSFRTLRAAAAVEAPKTKGSRFLGEAFPVADEAAAQSALAAVRTREYAATHHVWAWRLGLDGAARASDDGEPSGSGGQPTLREIEARELTDCLVVVTRYYGGTKLGTGGLARAYGEAAGLALDAAPAVTRIVRRRVRLRFAFADTAPAMRLLDVFDAVVADQTYDVDGSTLDLDVRAGEVEALGAAFVEATSGRGSVEAADGA